MGHVSWVSRLYALWDFRFSGLLLRIRLFPRPGLAKVHSSLGFQWILVDTEHGAIGDTEMHGMIPSIISSGVSPIVRVPAPEIAFVKRALDAGAHGIMFPMIETKVSVLAVQ